MKTFEVVVSQIVSIHLDETKFTPWFMEGYRENFIRSRPYPNMPSIWRSSALVALSMVCLASSSRDTE